MRGTAHDSSPFLAMYVTAAVPTAKLSALLIIIYQVRCTSNMDKNRYPRIETLPCELPPRNSGGHNSGNH